MNDFRDDFDDGLVVGRIPAEVKPKARRKRPLRSGNDDVTIKVAGYDPLKAFTRAQVEAKISIRRKQAARKAKAFTEWTSLDLAQAWRQRLWDKDLGMHHSNVLALAAHFAKQQQCGVSNESLDAISQLFFADRRRWRELPGEELYRAFIAQMPDLLVVAKRRSESTKPRADGSIPADDFWARLAASEEASA